MDDITDATGASARLTIGAAQAGWRLDKAAGLLWPDMGLRGRRRRIEAGGLTVNGRVMPPATKVRAGDELVAVAVASSEATVAAADIPVVADGPDYAALVKPGGLHSASLGPGGGPSLEDLLPTLFPGRAAILLSRLDELTSGLVPVAFSQKAAATYRRLEDAGQVEKTYLAVVHGLVDAPFTTARALDVDDRATTRVLARETTDPLRVTRVRPEDTRGGCTLVACRIHKGARHQIRAHLAAAGHPIVGDPRYGRGEGERLYLHCAGLLSPVLSVTNQPSWTLDAAVALARED